MAAPHPHLDATYRLIPGDGDSFTVEVAIPGSAPTKVSGFDSQAKAEAWIERHKANVATGSIMQRSNWRTAVPYWAVLNRPWVGRRRSARPSPTRSHSQTTDCEAPRADARPTNRIRRGACLSVR
jgi:hypothetical protein